MIIKFKRGAAHLGYAYRKGCFAASLPIKDCKYLIEAGIAEDVTPVKKARPQTAQVKKAKVKTADIKK